NGRAEDVLSTLVVLTSGVGPCDARGRAAHAGERLAVALGDGAAARRLRTTRRALALSITASCPVDLRASLLAVPWIAEGAEAEVEGAVSTAQVGEALSLVRALSSRERLRPLLDQVLDALILWTGVERGLLLMPAPDGRLVPRSARNLSRDDLRG